jgi:uncharacterized protein DUF1064
MGALRLTEKQLREIQARTNARGSTGIKHSIATRGEAPSKYRNQKTEVDGEVFDSKREAERYRELRLMEKAGEISDLKRQVSFDLIVNEMLVCRYVADATYLKDNRLVVIDVKGYATELYKLKKKLMLACRGIRVLET